MQPASNEQFTNAMIDLVNNMLQSNRLINDMNMLPLPESNINAFGNSIGLNNILQQSIEDAKPVYKNVISDDAKESLETIKYSSDLSCNLCAITQEEFKEGQDIIRLPCGHCFNKVSILEWLETTKAECPTCRYALPSKEIKDYEKISEDSISDDDDDEDVEADVEEEENDLSQNLVYTRIMRRFVTPPAGVFMDRDITRRYLSRNIQYLHNEEDDIELQAMLFQSLSASQDISGN